MISTFLGYQIYGNNLPQSLKRTSQETAVSQAAAYFNANIGKVKTVGDLVNNYRLLSYATQAFGLQDMTSAKALLTQVLTSDLSSKNSVANKLNDSRYTAFAQAFNFNTKGTLSAPLQTSAQQASTEALFAAKTTLGAAAAASATKSYEAAMSSITSVSELEKSPAALGYVLIAYGIDASTASSTFERTLESDLSDTKSLINQQPESGYSALADAFNVAADGSTSSATQAQSSDAIAATTDAYMSTIATDSASQKAAAAETNYYTATIGSITSVTQLLADKRLTTYITKAYGLPSGANAKSITQALTSDMADKTSYATTSPFPAYRTLAKAFNFTTGGVADQVPFQSAAQTQSTVQLYLQRQTSNTPAAQAATAYYTANIGAVTSVADLENDPTLLAYALTAYGVDPATPASTVAAILKKSDSLDTGYLGLAQAFSLNADGTAASAPQAETATNIEATTAAYTKTFASDPASQKSAATETNYFLSQISTLTTADALVGDKRLLAYVVKAYGLPSNATASIVEQALTSDTTDSGSFANTAGAGYAKLAKAFNFTGSGGARSVTQLQSTREQQITTQLFAERSTASAADANTATAYYNAKIGKVASASDLAADPKLLSYVVTAYGLDPKTSAASVMGLLQNTGGILDKYNSFAAAFTLNPNGSPTQSVPQTPDNIAATTQAYVGKAGSDTASQATAGAEAAYYAATIGTIKSVDDLVSNTRLVSDLKTAFGLPANASAATIKQALTSDLTSSASFANTADASYLSLAKAFNFSPGGTPQLQTAAQQQTVEQLYAANTTADTTTSAAATAYYKTMIANVQSVSDITSDPRLLSYLGTAFGIDLAANPLIVPSVLGGTHALLDTAKNDTLVELKAAFNVDGHGSATGGAVAESSKDVTATTTAYMSNAKPDKASQAAANAATIYFKSAVAKVTSVSDLLNDPKLVAYIKQAYSLPAGTTAAALQKVLTSDVSNPKSAAATMGAAYQQVAAAFDFSAGGLVAPATTRAASKSQLNAINAAYLDQQMQTEAGAQNPGIALALYFQANAGKVTDAYSILADKKLTVVFQTMMGLPATASGADIDAQAKTITNQFHLADLKDPKKLQSLIQRFSVLYDLNPPKSTAPFTAASVLTGSTDTLDVTSLFGSSPS